MEIMKSAVLLSAGGIIATALVLSCSDDSPPAADAATCECPAAEPPLAGRLIRVSNPQLSTAGQRVSQDATCPEGALLISGSCTTADVNTQGNLLLEQSGFYRDDGRGWRCAWKNDDVIDIPLKVTAICLKPMP